MTLGQTGQTIKPLRVALMENSAYEDCLELMSFYDVYCSKSSGVIEADTSGGFLFLALIIAACCIGMIEIKSRP
jgi:hypothetical protein